MPVMLGSNRDEGSLFTKQFYDFTPEQMVPPHVIFCRSAASHAARGAPPVTPLARPTHVPQVSFLDSTFGPAASKQIQSLYPLTTYSSPWHALEMIDGDISFSCPARRSARWLAAAPSAQPVYLYHFVHVPEITSPDKHVLCCHSCELSFVFHYDAGLITPGERALSKTMVGLWSSFGTNHAPTDAATWPQYAAAADQSVVLDATALDAKLSVQSGLKQARCANAVRALHAMFAPCLHRKSRRNSTEAPELLVVNRFYRGIQNPALLSLLMHARAFSLFDALSG